MVLKIHMLQLNSISVTKRGDKSMVKGIIRPNLKIGQGIMVLNLKRVDLD